MTLRLYLHNPTTIMEARVNQSSFDDPLAEFQYDNIDPIGAWADTGPGMTMLLGTTQGGDDLGRQRLRKQADNDTIFFGMSSEDTHDGELDPEDDAYITITDMRKPWAIPPRYDDDGEAYKDYNLSPAGSVADMPPVANTGPGTAGTIDSGTSKLRVQLPAGGSNTSFATKDGESISAYAWTLPSGVSLVGGYTTADAVIKVDCDPGFYWVELLVQDSNSEEHTAYVPIFARDPDSDDSITAFQILDHNITAQGQKITLQIFEEISVPDGTLAIIWEDEPASESDRSHIVFIGWVHDEAWGFSSKSTATLENTTLTLLDMGGWLDMLPGFPQIIVDSNRDTASTSPAWTVMTSPNMDKYMHYLLHWHSNALDLADFTWSGEGSNYAFAVLGSTGQSLFDQVEQRATAMVPDFHFTCDRYGSLWVKPDPILQDTGDRTATSQATLAVANWQQITGQYKRHPRAHWLREDAIVASNTAIDTVFCIAPGDAPGQGVQAPTQSYQLAQNQSDLNSQGGHRYSRINAKYGRVKIKRVLGNYDSLDPALKEWVTVTSSTTHRNRTLSSQRCLLHGVNVKYNYTPYGLTRTVDLDVEVETDGVPASTYIPPQTDLTSYDGWYTEYPPYEGVDLTGPESYALFKGIGNIVLVTTSGKLFRTSDFSTPEASGGPTWDQVNLSLSGTVYSFVVDPFSPLYIGTGTDVNGWIATSTNLYYIEDMFGASPTVNNQLTFPSAITSDTGFRTLDASFGNFFSNSAWVACVSYYDDEAGHTGTWIYWSTNGGSSWNSEVQITSHYNTSPTVQRPPLYLSPKTAGKVYSAAFTATGSQPAADGYESDDYGATWSALSNPNILPGNSLGAGMHVPWPDNADESLVYHYRVTYSGGTSNGQTRRVEGTSVTDISPTYNSQGFGPRMEKFSIRTFDNDRRFVVMAGYDDADPDVLGVWVSSDHGANWTLVTINSITGVAFAGNTEQVIYMWGSDGRIKYSQNFGVTVEDKKGNISTDYSNVRNIIGIAGG